MENNNCRISVGKGCQYKARIKLENGKYLYGVGKDIPNAKFDLKILNPTINFDDYEIKFFCAHFVDGVFFYKLVK